MAGERREGDKLRHKYMYNLGGIVFLDQKTERREKKQGNKKEDPGKPRRLKRAHEEKGKREKKKEKREKEGRVRAFFAKREGERKREKRGALFFC